MEEMSDWISSVMEKSSDTDVMDVQIVSQMIQRKELSIERVVTDLGPFLTNSETKERLKGLQVLSLILNSLPIDFLSSEEVKHLTHFYCDRLKDHHSVIPKVFAGLLTIINCVNVDKDLSQKIFNSLTKEISVQQLSASERFLVFQLLIKIFETYSEEFKAIRADFIYGLIQAIEGERDPRCLLLVFRLVHSVIKSIELDPFTEDVFEVISCYFPVLFSPPPNDEYGITKEDLSEALNRCFRSCSGFSEFLFPLVLEKLESELITARIDSFKVIEEISPTYGFDKIKEYVPQLWTAIRIDAFKPKLLENEISKHALRALTSISDSMVSNQSNVDSFIELIWNDISNAFNKPELDLMESAIDMVLATISSNAYAFNKFMAQLMPILLKQFTFCTKESIRIVIIDSISRILSHSRKLEKNEIKIINSESLFALFTSLSVADTESETLRETVISCLQQLIHSIEMKANHWKVISQVFRSIFNNCFYSEKLILKTYSLMESIVPLNPQVIEKLVTSLIDNFDLDYSTEANQKRLNCSLNAFAFTSSEFNSFQMIVNHLVEQIKANSYYIDENRELLSLEVTKSLKNCITKQTKVEFEEKVNLFLYDNCFDPLIQQCIHLSICTDNKSGTSVNIKLIDQLFALIGSGVSKLNSEYSQRLFDKLSQFSTFGKVDRLLPVLPPTCFCTFQIGPQFLDSLNDSQAFIVFGVMFALISNLKYKSSSKDLIELFDKLLVFAMNNKYNNLEISALASKSLGSLVNRFDSKDQVLNEKLKQVLILFEERINESQESDDNKLLIINVCVWITKGLVIGGHGMRTDFIAFIIRLVGHQNKNIRNEASKAFSIIHTLDDNCLTADNNANVRIFYHQSFYLETFDGLLNGYKSEDSEKKQSFLSSLLMQLDFIPKTVFRNELKKLLPMLLDAISDDNTQTTQTAALDAIAEILNDENKQLLDPSLKSTVNNCINLSINSPNLKVRRSALNCLALIANTFDDSILNQLRDEVVRSLRLTLNDKKRIVRKSAVTARCKWILVGQPGK